MGCPHGNGPAEKCSQCLGMSARRVVKIDEGMFQVGDDVIDRTIGPAKTANYGTVQIGTKYVARCRYCAKAGHQTENCRERIENEVLATSYLGGASVAIANDKKRRSRKNYD